METDGNQKKTGEIGENRWISEESRTIKEN